LKILYFSRDYTTHDFRFLTVLAKTEHEIGFLRSEPCRRVLESRPVPQKVTQINWFGNQSHTRWYHLPILVAGLKKVIREFQPDLIHAGPIQRSAFLTALAGFHPLVTMSWGYDLLFDVHQNQAWKWATRFTLKNSDLLIADCKTIKELAVAFGMASDRVVIFPWGVDIKKYTPIGDKEDSPIRQQLGWGKNNFVLISTRTWSELYGVNDLAKAFSQAVKQHPNLRLLMLGDGPLGPKIKKIFSKSGVCDFVHFPGHISQDVLPEYYQAADLYISSSHSDGTSISLLEALACGIPALLTDIPGNKEWIEVPGEIGWLYKDGDANDLTQGIHYAYENQNLLPAMARQARRVSELKGDWQKNFPRLFEAYRIAQS
jgi:glycosyltransferase involved in cell wall biosynthesis